MSTLFPLPADAVAITSDDCYTPRWVASARSLLSALAAADRYGAVLYGRAA